MASRTFGARGAESAWTTGFTLGAVLSIATFRTTAAARAHKALRTGGAILARLALLAGEAGEALIALHASCACGAVEARCAVMARTPSRALSARRPGGKPVADLILDMGVKGGDAGNLAVQTVHFVLHVVELVDDCFVAVCAGCGERGGSIARHTETSHRHNDQNEGQRSNRRQPALLLVGRVPIHDLIGIEVQRGGRTDCHGRSTLFQWVWAWGI